MNHETHRCGLFELNSIDFFSTREKQSKRNFGTSDAMSVSVFMQILVIQSIFFVLG